MNGLVEWVIFGALALIAVVSAASMILTMSMYRAGLALMSSFVALAGIFVLLNADMLAAIQIMMNVGGMLIMVLFMVMLMMDPGGEMMWDMKRAMRMPGLGALSMRPPKGPPPPEEPAPHHEARQAHDMERSERTAVYTCPMHPEVRQSEPGACPKCGMTLVPATDTAPSATGRDDAMAPDQAGHAEHSRRAEMGDRDMGDMGGDMGNDGGGAPSGHEAHGGMTPRQNYQMMVDMAMSTAQTPLALALGVLAAALLIVIVVLTPWTISAHIPTGDASAPVGVLLLGRYMVGFEGAAFLIVAGIVAAVIFARREPREPREPHEVTPMEITSVQPFGAGVTAHTGHTGHAAPAAKSQPQARAGTGAPDATHADHTMSAPQKDQEELSMSDETATPTGDMVYTCPMHPEIRQAAPGKCPICGMFLVPAEKTPPDQPEHGSHEEHGSHNA